jgi:hypothetical protein
MRKDLDGLQNMYKHHQDNPHVAPHLLESIKGYMTSKGFEKFQAALLQPFTETDWPSTLLHHLAKQLNIDLNPTPVVQATVQDGKVYWRLVLGENVIYDRAAEKKRIVTFTKENSWYMDWRLFREFKDSGKRYSNIRITRERFIASFSLPDQNIAGHIWNELKQRGILSAKDRLTHDWRAVGKKYIKLNAIEATKKKAQWYTAVANHLHTITNNPDYAEIILNQATFKIFRPDRTPKTWASTGLIMNLEPKTLAYCTTRWDIGTYGESKNHRNTALDEERYQETGIDYDHILAKAALKHTSTSVQQAHLQGITSVKNDIALLKENGYPKSELNPTFTDDDKEINKLYKDLTEDLAGLENKFKLERNEFSYTIATPRELHNQSKTYKKSSKSQAKRNDHPFLEDVAWLLEKIKKSPLEFALIAVDDFIHALGAYRTLYHAECKAPAAQQITDQPIVGRLAFEFFKNRDDRKKIDELFINEAKAFMTRREGVLN